jgi:uncharacterized protein DUF3606
VFSEQRTRASKEITMARTSRGRAQDRRRVAGGQDYEVRYESKKTSKSNKRVKSSRETRWQFA